MRAAIYARVSTLDQEPENQLAELRQYTQARGWNSREFVDRMSGAIDTRPALDRLLADARRRRFDVVLIWSLDRLGRSLRHLIELLDELRALDVSLVSLREGLDLSTPAGRLQWQIIAAISEFERERLRERVRAGLARVKAGGKPLGRPRVVLSAAQVDSVKGLSVRQAARRLGLARSTVHRCLSENSGVPEGA